MQAASSFAGQPPVGAADRASAARRLAGWALLTAAIAAYYLLLLSNGSFRLFAPEALGHAFGSMLEHLLHGDFGVDRAAIEAEAFTRDGKTYAYFGIAPALLRLPVPLFGDLRHADISRASCLAAVVLFVLLQLRSLLLVHADLPERQRNSGLLLTVGAAVVLSGPQLYLLASASIFHEAVFWGAALGAAFNFVLLRAALHRATLTAGEITALAVLAGIALHTRVSVGFGLCLAASMLTLWMVWRAASGRLIRERAAAMARGLLRPSFLLPVLVLALFAAAAGVVNFERWGNPLRFADFRFYDFAHRQPYRLDVINHYGELNPIRIWVSALYYATGMPYVVKNIAPFSEYLRTHFDGLQAPPNSGLLTNPLTIFLAACGLWGLCRHRDRRLPGTALVSIALIGHAATVLVLLSAMYLALRYRFDFAPFMTLAALLGYRLLSQKLGEISDLARRRVMAAVIAACAIGIVGSHYILIVYKVASDTVPMDVRQALLPLAPFAHAAFER